MSNDIRPLTEEEYARFLRHPLLDGDGETEDQMIRRLDHEFQRKLHASGQFDRKVAG